MANTLFTWFSGLITRSTGSPQPLCRKWVLPPVAAGGLFMFAFGFSPVVAPARVYPTPSSLSDVAAQPSVVPAELEALVKQGEAAANARKPAAFASLATGGAKDFNWTVYASEIWRCDVLDIPQTTGAPAASLGRHETLRPAVFHAVDLRHRESSTGGHHQDAPTAPYLAVFHAWHTCEGEGDHVYRLIHAGRTWKLGEEIPESDPGAFRIRDHALNVRLDVGSRKASITDAFQVERTGPDLPDYGLFRISQDFQLHNLTLAGNPERQIVFRQVGGVVAFVPPPARTFTLNCAYAGALNHASSDYIKSDEASLESYWYPHTARLPATTTITAIAPPDWTALAQGEQVHSEHQSDGSTAVTYRNDIPNSFYTLDMGRYNVTSRTIDGRILSVYQLKADAGLARSCLDTLGQAIEFYSARFGTFPYSRYGVVETRGDFPGALEAYSFATFGPHTLPELIPHELSHTWWGGLVPCPYTRSMWNEAFAEYSDDLFHRTVTPDAYAREHPSDPQALLQTRLLNTRSFRTIALANAYNTMDDRQVRVGYEKGRLIMHALEDQLGQETLLRSLHIFVSQHPHGEAADWSEFAAVVNQVTGQDYGWFFAQWIGRVGLPAVRLENVITRDDDQGNWVEADIVQDGAPYRLKMGIRLEQQDGTNVDSIAEVRGAITHIRVKADARPARLALDPEGVLPLAEPAHQPIHTDATVYEWPSR